MEELKAFLVKLMFCQGISNIGRLKLLNYCLENQRTALSMNEMIQIAKLFRTKAIFEESFAEADLLVKQNTRSYFTILDEIYPEALKEINNPPVLLFYQGDLSLLAQRSLAVVGSRVSSTYGQKVLKQLIPGMVFCGFVVVSGLAKGIDGLAHKMTIANDGQTIAVIGNGIDCCYPKENQALQDKIKQEHLLLSEYPDGVPPRKYHFPMRNRIIAGLTWGTCVIEARQRSGSLITAQLASEEGREVFAVPGDILSGQSTGCLELIQDGAKCIMEIGDIIDEFEYFRT
ncbi:DNA processing protein [Enterococcus sp. PF1-24]|uniref:DNA-processing protein DprA n=1 Tax=unclassified Enterococcus TaxID=2608891 RepID=UPI002472FF91|nr:MULTISPECIES: DNA-processing protein DprA [unclassified Enterococcus]MDH6363163.1 DNA processing protein [Enterococcus sp. PFB1-1]MDH6400257.1 DNA processing protein [Enterococcus sp. PF1-24]